MIGAVRDRSGDSACRGRPGLATWVRNITDPVSLFSHILNRSPILADSDIVPRISVTYVPRLPETHNRRFILMGALF